MNSVKFFIKIFLTFFLLQTTVVNGQDKSSFYININAVQEYHSNLYRLPDSLKKADFRFNSFLRLGYQKNWTETGKFVNIYVENSIQRYFSDQTYNRMKNELFVHGNMSLGSINKLYINDRLRFRNYNHNNGINSLRNSILAYLQTTLTDYWQFNNGYSLWLKKFPNSDLYQNYLSHRLFINLYYSLNQKTKIGLRNELNWHQGNLYPYGTPKEPGANLKGFRYTGQFSGNRIFAGKYFFDLRYRFEWDTPQDINVQQFGDFSGDENTEDLLAEDSDFDYVKHQLSASMLYKATPSLFFFGFAVLQSKHFNHWKIDDNNTLRNDLFSYMSLTAKYHIHSNIFSELYFNLEYNHSNLYYYKYSKTIVGIGLRYKL